MRYGRSRGSSPTYAMLISSVASFNGACKRTAHSVERDIVADSVISLSNRRNKFSISIEMWNKLREIRILFYDIQLNVSFPYMCTDFCWVISINSFFTYKLSETIPMIIYSRHLVFCTRFSRFMLANRHTVRWN